MIYMLYFNNITFTLCISESPHIYNEHEIITQNKKKLK